MAYTIEEIRRENFLFLFEDRAGGSNKRFTELTGVDASACSNYKRNTLNVSRSRAEMMELGLSLQTGWMEVNRIEESGLTPAVPLGPSRGKNTRPAVKKAPPETVHEPATMVFSAPGFELSMVLHGGKAENKISELALEIIKLRTS